MSASISKSIDAGKPILMPPSPLTIQVGGGHYKGLVIQPVEYCQKNKLSFCESSVIKYVSRHREKNGRQDIEKAIHFLNLLLELEYPVTDHAEPLPPQQIETGIMGAHIPTSSHNRTL